MKKRIYGNKSDLTTSESFIGESLEEKIRRQVSTKAPIENISPMLYTERKDGVKPEYDIRTDRWELAQKTMNGVAERYKEKWSKAGEKTTTTEAQA